MAVAEVQVVDNVELGRYEARLAGEVLGFAAYRRQGGLLVFTHTEVDPTIERRGVGSALVRGALDDVRARGGMKVRPLCPFVRAYVERHPEYADLL